MKNLFAFLDRFISKRLTREQIIDETVEFYSADISRRSSNGNSNSSWGCKYNHENGNHCAVGRCLLPEYKKQGTDLMGNTDGIRTFLTGHKLKNIDQALESQYRGQSINLWRDLQDLHDTGSHWEEGGLTQLGKDFVKKLKEKKD